LLYILYRMQFNIKSLLSHHLLIAMLIVVFILIYFFQKEIESSHLPRFKADKRSLSPSPSPHIVDREPLIREDPSIIPANEVYQTSYRDWAGLDNTIYSKDVPLFNAGDKKKMDPPNINSQQRRVNFIEVD
jgi:hypothetical protein